MYPCASGDKRTYPTRFQLILNASQELTDLENRLGPTRLPPHTSRDNILMLIACLESKFPRFERILLHCLKSVKACSIYACASPLVCVRVIVLAKQFGIECWCGDSEEFATYDRHGDGICDIPCSGDTSVACGEGSSDVRGNIHTLQSVSTHES